MNYWKLGIRIAEISPIRKVLPDLTTTIENIPEVDSIVIKSLVGKYEIQPALM
jgi:hypothetical protein